MIPRRSRWPKPGGPGRDAARAMERRRFPPPEALHATAELKGRTFGRKKPDIPSSTHRSHAGCQVISANDPRRWRQIRCLRGEDLAALEHETTRGAVGRIQQTQMF